MAVNLSEILESTKMFKKKGRENKQKMAWKV
jgi:hypothetical protein